MKIEITFQTGITLTSALLITLIVGCGKEEPSAPQSATQGSSSQPVAISLAGNSGAPAAPPPAPLTVVGGQPSATEAPVASGPGGQKDDSGADLGLEELNSALRQYVDNFDALPTSLLDLIKNGYISAIPPAPPGKKYQIDPKAKKIVISN